MAIYKYDVIYADFPKTEDRSIQYGKRPAVVIQNNIGNKQSTTLLVIPLSTKLKKGNMPTHLLIENDKDNGLRCNSMLMAEQLTTIGKSRVLDKIGRISDREIQKAIFKRFIYSSAYGKNDDDLNDLLFI